MAKRRKAEPVTLSDGQRERLERLWFYYGNYGPKNTPGNHQFIQGLLEHGLNLRPLQTKRTPKSELPTPECERAVEAILAASSDGAEDVGWRPGGLSLIPSPGDGRKASAQDLGMKELLDDIRHRYLQRHGPEGCHSGGEDAA